MRWLRSLIETSVTDGEHERIFRGLGVSGGIAVGPVHILHDEHAAQRSFHSTEEEAVAFRSALEAAQGQLESLIASQGQIGGGHPRISTRFA